MKFTSKTDLEKFLIGASAAIAVAGVLYLIPAEAIVALGTTTYIAVARLMPTIYSLGNALTETPEGGVARTEIQAAESGVMKSVGS